MKRVEPSIGSFDLTEDPAVVAAALDRERLRENRDARSRWFWILLLSVVMPVALVAYGAHRGAIGGPPDDPSRLPGLVALAGIVVLYGSQLIAGLYLFSRSIMQGMMSLIVPGYFIVALRRSKAFGPVATAWLCGACALAVGTILSS